MNSKTERQQEHHARILVDPSARRKVLVIPTRIDLSLGQHKIVWSLENRDDARIVKCEFKPKRDGDPEPQIDAAGHTATLDIENRDTDDDVDRSYVVSVQVGRKLYSSEPQQYFPDCQLQINLKMDRGQPQAHLPPVAMMAPLGEGPVIRNHPI